jgi:hypothetical protein
MDDGRPYSDWPAEPHHQWIAAGNAFGRHLLAAARDYAFGRIPTSASPEAQELARKAALDAIYGMMMLLDGVAASPVGQDHSAEYVLLSRIRSRQSGEAVEQFELAPDGDGLSMGYHGWVAGDFGR